MRSGVFSGFRRELERRAFAASMRFAQFDLSS
jgi:hypothetical protein